MSRNFWNDGGGHYPPGTDTRNAPWNRPDAPDPDDCDIEAAETEIYPFVNFEAEATLRDVQNACDYLNTEETIQVSELVEVCDKPHPLSTVPADLKAEVMKQAKAYVNERCRELVRERMFEECPRYARF